jgi:hypothetical protein
MQFRTILPLAFLLDRNIFFNTLFSDAHSVYFSFDLRDQVSQPYETIGKIMFLYFKVYEE